MANEKPDLSSLIRTVRPTQLGKAPKPTLDQLQVAKPAMKLFRMEGGEVKIPRKRATSEQWPKWFEELDAPRTIYMFVKDEQTQIEVTWDESTELFHDADGNQYTGDNVVEYGEPDAREITASPELLQQLRNAITRFNNKTGKKLSTRFVKAQRDSSGRTIEQTEMVFRAR